jgi:hypothetical protein
MDEEELHDLRMTIGQHSMDLADALANDEMIALVGAAREPALALARGLLDADLSQRVVLGLLMGLVVNLVDDAAD